MPDSKPEHQKLVEQSQEMIEQTKVHIAHLKKEIDATNTTLAKQRKDLNKLLDSLDIKHD